MKITSIGAILLLFATFTSSGCMFLDGVDGNGHVIKETREVSSFSGLYVGGAFNVFLTQGGSESLSIEADENLMPLIETRVKGNTLEITSKENIGRYKKLNIYINFENLKTLDVSGACEVKGEGLGFPTLRFEASGASDVELNLTADDLICDYSGASEITLSGKAGKCNIEMSGANEIDAYDLEVGDMEINASGASDAKIFVTGSLKVRSSGASSIRYKGSPTVDSDVSCAGSLSKR